ncbi:MAG: hypothetical protein H7327_02160 [Herminiimonas sp.]|nr:hypothetical protein [Herminiimonas sp.]
MPIEQIGKYEIEYESEALPDDAGWAAFVAVYGESENPAHRKEIVARKRVALEASFNNEAAALDEARRIARSMLE